MIERSAGRRDFLKATAVIAAGAVWGQVGGSTRGQSQPGRPLKACQFGMLPKELADSEKFILARKCGFEGVEHSPMADAAAARELGALSRQAGVPIHSLCYGGWGAPLSDPRPEVVDKGLAGVEAALRSARDQGADVILLVPAVVNEEVGYAEAYSRSQANIRKLLPLAAELRVTIAVENVWNKFLLSPVEFSRYVDEFDNPWLRAYIDVGNMILFGYAQDWVRTVGKRIVRIHLKDFKREGYQWTNLLDGDVNWPQVRKALAEIGYNSFMTTELGGGDEAYLTDLAKRIDKIIAMS
ncbi:MAG TPA: sugar phosphate isomerase/epimerase family protein [Sedimentisphaerales bacterium]|jgi:hexulose-6-phosphate isomerase|nr:sugar phosphate isomerase/epimerase family protein [Sedimentisphaerales bacterium]HNU29244.1 sugar phosphate isomerase/epimerase family protein [Sedimentisphaerales bacterium]